MVFIQTMGRDVSRDKKPNLFHILVNLPKDKMEIKFVLGKRPNLGGGRLGESKGCLVKVHTFPLILFIKNSLTQLIMFHSETPTFMKSENSSENSMCDAHIQWV